MFSWLASQHPSDLPLAGRMGAAFTDASLDLAEGSGHYPEAEAQLQAALASQGAGPLTVSRMLQVHGDQVATASAQAQSSPVTADALITTTRGVALMVRVADCLPILLADSNGAVIAAVHAGRRGVELDILTRAVDQMRAVGAEQIAAWIGPHVCGNCYEVPDQMRAEVADLVPETCAETSWGTPALDLAAGAAAQLSRAEVNVVTSTRCTLEDPTMHSYRRDGAASGRLAGLIWMEEDR